MKIKNWGIPLLSIILTCLFPCAFMFFQNAGEASAKEFLPVLWIYLAVAVAALLVLLLIFRNVGRAAFMTDLGMLVVMNFTMICNGIKKLIPSFHNIIFLVLCGVLLLGLLILMLRKKPNMVIPCGLVSLAFGVMILMNGALALPTIISTATYELPGETPVVEEMPQVDTAAMLEASAAASLLETAESEPVEIPVVQQKFTREKRNVYFLIFDEFGGPDNLQHYFGDDNGQFFAALEERGFSVSHTSKNPESPWTVTLIPNIMNLDYVTSDEEEIKNRMLWLEDPALYQLFRNNGYSIDLINHEGMLGETGCRVITQGRRRENIGDVIFDNGMLSQIPGVAGVLREDVLKQGSDEYTSLMDVSAALLEVGSTPKNGPTLTVGYFMMPHAPFAADANGNPTPEEIYYEWRENEPYVGMLHYTSDVILKAVDNIREHDPDAVILLLADHGARKPGHIYNQYGGPTFDADVESPFMMNVLCCVLDPENKVDVEGDTCINAARKTFDKAFGLTMGTLPVPPDYELSADDIISDMGRGY